MYSDAFQKIIRGRKLTLAIIWGAMGLMSFILTFVSYTVAPTAPPPGGGLIPPVIFWLLSLVLAVFSIGAPAVFLSGSRVRSIFGRDLDSLKVQLKAVSPLTKFEGLSRSEINFSYLSVMYQTSIIIRLVFSQTISIFGFVSSLQTRTPSEIVPFVAVTLVLNVLAFPKLDDFLAKVSLLANHGGAGV
jgi:hypothetical protein